MGIYISHGVPSSRSATTIANLGKHLAHTLTSAEWREVSHLFGGGLCAPVYLPAAEAGRVGDLLHQAARSRRMGAEWAQLACLIGDAGKRAARAGQTWEWT